MALAPHEMLRGARAPRPRVLAAALLRSKLAELIEADTAEIRRLLRRRITADTGAKIAGYLSSWLADRIGTCEKIIHRFNNPKPCTFSGKPGPGRKSSPTRYFRDEHGDYLVVDMTKPVDGQVDVYEARIPAARGDIGSIAATAVNLSKVIEQCKRVSKSNVPPRWQRALAC